MTLNPYTIAPLLAMIYALASGLFVLRHSVSARLNKIYALFCLMFVGWFSMYLTSNINISKDMLELWMRISFCFVCFTPMMCFSFVTEFFQLPRNIYWYRVNLIIASLFSILTLTTDLIIVEKINLPWFPYSKAGSLHFLVVLHCYWLSFIMIDLMAKSLKRSDITIQKRNQIKYILAGMILMTFCTVDFLGQYITIFPIGSYIVIIYLTLLNIAIYRHKLLDINVVLKKGLIYSFLITTITLLYMLVVFLFERISQQYIGYRDFTASMLSASLIAIFFTPLKNKIQNTIDKYFFKGSQAEIAEENELLRQEVIQTERLKSIAILASGIAHEIKNPLTALKTFSEYLTAKKSDPEFLEKFSPIIKSEVNRINDLVHQLLDFAKPSPAQLKKENIIEIINSTLALFHNDFMKHKIGMETHYKSTDLFLNLDYKQIKQVFLNIFLNAIESMPKGGTFRVSISLKMDRFVNIRIQDTGIGISKQDLKHIFDPFFTNKDNGTGLGLAITHEIIKNHNGRIFVESTIGKGTIFTIELPYNSPL